MDKEHEGEASPLLGEFKIMLRRSVASLKRELLVEILEPEGELRSSVLELRDKLDWMQNSLSATREMTNSLALGSVAALSSKKPLNPGVAAQLQSADMFLRSEVISAVSISSVARYLTSAFSASDHGLEGICIMLFAPGAHARKKARKTDIGRKFVDLRLRIIRNMVSNCHVGVRGDALGLLQPLLLPQERRGSSSEPSASQEAGISGMRGASELRRAKESPFRPPAWTARGFIGKEDIEIAVEEIIKQEVDESDDVDSSAAEGGMVQTQPNKRRKTSSSPKHTVREEISREIVKHMWKRWTDWFGNARNEARKSFTLDLGVVFLEPSSRWKPMCSCNSVDEYLYQVETVPLTENCSLFQTNYEASSTNLRTFENMLKDFPDFILTCQYNVDVFDGVEDMARNQGGQEVTMRRNLNLLQVAANFLTAYFQVSSLEAFLGANERSLRFILITALCFSDIVHRASRPRTGKNSQDQVCSEAKELGLLIPGNTGRLHFLVEKCLKMTKEKLDALNLRDHSYDGNVGEFISGEEIASDDEDVCSAKPGSG